MNTALCTDAPLPLLHKHQEYPDQLSIAGLINPTVSLDDDIDKELKRLKSKINASFWSKLKANDLGCMEYQGVKKDGRYGWMRIGSKCYYTHRVAAWLVNLVQSPRAPKNQSIKGYVLHHCDNPPCCNPAHLWIGNQSDNQRDCYSKGRHNPPSNYEYYHGAGKGQLVLAYE